MLFKFIIQHAKRFVNSVDPRDVPTALTHPLAVGGMSTPSTNLLPGRHTDINERCAKGDNEKMYVKMSVFG